MDIERDEEYTGFNAQNDPDFLYEHDEFISEMTKDVYSDLETIKVEEPTNKPFLPKVMTKYTGIEGGKRTIETVNPEWKSYNRKKNALQRSINIWMDRRDLHHANGATKAYELAEKQIAKGKQKLELLGEEPVKMITVKTDVKVMARELREEQERNKK